MIRGPELAVGVPKAVSPVTKGIKHCGTPTPQDATFVETANCWVRTEVTLPRLRTLKASQLNSSLARSFFSGNLRVSRISSETALGKIKVLRPRPGLLTWLCVDSSNGGSWLTVMRSLRASRGKGWLCHLDGEGHFRHSRGPRQLGCFAGCGLPAVDRAD